MDIYLRLIGDLGLDETVLIDGYENAEEKEGDYQEEQAPPKETKAAKGDKKTTPTKTVPNTNNRT